MRIRGGAVPAIEGHKDKSKGLHQMSNKGRIEV